MGKRHTRLDWIVALSSLSVFIAVASLVNAEKALVAASFFLAFAIVLATKYDFYRQSLRNAAFWTSYLALGVVHIVVIASVHVPNLTSGMVAFPIAALDCAVLWLVVSAAEKLSKPSG